MKVALAQINCHIGNFESNTSRIISMVHEAEQGGADLVIFPEMITSGYPPLDFLEFADFIRKCESAITEIAKACTGIAAIVGSPSPNPVLKGKNLYNSAYFLAGGTIQKVVHKTLLPTYNIFDEYRYFEPNTEFGIIELKGIRIALTVCEDLWNEEDDPLYVFSPMEKIMPLQPSLMVNIAASPFDYQQEEKRKAILTKNVRKYGLPLIYVNHVGAQTDIIFDGGSLVINKNGEIVSELSYFKEELRIVETEKIATMEPARSLPPQKSQRIYEALVMGIRDYFKKMNFTKATLGLSGGVDSALVLVLAAEALGKENVFPVMMPSSFSTEHSLTDSIKLADNLDIETVNIPINIIYDKYISELKPYFKGLPFNTAEENIQARIRGTLLMALSNKFGYILLNTSNKSELAVGYGTLYGDMCGGISVLGDVYKTEIYALCRYINRDKEIIPQNIITKPPSAELRPGQKDTDSLPDYEILDKVLYQYIEQNQGPDELLAKGFDPGLVHRVLKLVNTNEYKRFQFAPILRVSPIAFGRGRRMPLAAKYLS
jgi:NAD+ synthase (glutamine-hydrolysing)